eukprot:scaffold130093_cov43-Attheya_sp.AAC.1
MCYSRVRQCLSDRWTRTPRLNYKNHCLLIGAPPSHPGSPRNSVRPRDMRTASLETLSRDSLYDEHSRPFYNNHAHNII